MAGPPSWLPPIVVLQSYAGDWEAYLNAVYEYFQQDFYDSKPYIGQAPVSLAMHALYRGKEETFWHVITKGGKTAAERTPHLRRCERIRWPRPVIEHITDSGVVSWSRWIDGHLRTTIWVEDADYVVVLIHKQGYYALLTAFCVEGSHERENLRTQYELYK